MQGGIVDRKEYQEFIFDRLSALPLSCVLHPLDCLYFGNARGISCSLSGGSVVYEGLCKLKDMVCFAKTVKS